MTGWQAKTARFWKLRSSETSCTVISRYLLDYIIRTSCDPSWTINFKTSCWTLNIGVLRDISFAKSVNYIKSCEEVRQGCELRLRSYPNHREWQHTREALIFDCDSGIIRDFRGQNALLLRQCTSVTGAHFIPVAGHEQQKFNMLYIVLEIRKNWSANYPGKVLAGARGNRCHVYVWIPTWIILTLQWSEVLDLFGGHSIGYRSDRSVILTQPFLHFFIYEVICHPSTFSLLLRFSRNLSSFLSTSKNLRFGEMGWFGERWGENDGDNVGNQL